RAFGGIEQTKETYRDVALFPLVDDLWKDLHYGARMLFKNPGFAIVAVLALAIGIGAETAIFSVVNAIVLNALAYYGPRRLVWVTNVFRGDEIIGANIYLTWQAQSKALDHLVAFVSGDMKLTGQGEPERVNCVLATANLFPALGVAPQLGRAFTPEE